MGKFAEFCKGTTTGAFLLLLLTAVQLSSPILVTEASEPALTVPA